MSADGRFAIVAGRRVLVGQLNAPSSSDRRLDLPAAGRCAAFAPDGALLVGLERSYLVYPPAGGDVEEGPTLGESSLITSLSAGSNLVAVADAGLRIIWLFDRSSALKAHVQAPDGGGFVVPSPHFDVAVAADGTLWVAHPGELRLEQRDAGGRLLRSWGRPGSRIESFCGCCNPTDFALLPGGGFVTAEKGLPRVKVYRDDGSLESVVAAPREFAEDVVGLDVAADAAGRVYAADPARGAVRVFERRTAAGEERR